MRNPTNAWWENEAPQIITTTKNTIRWYPQARKLQVSRPDWIDEATGETRIGKTATLDVAALPPEAAALLLEVAEAVGHA